jgi:hypothetical protein
MKPPIKVLLGSTLLICGCAGTFNPHIKLNRALTAPDTIAAAFAYADNAIDSYTDAMGNTAKLETITGTSFLLLSASAIGNSLTGGSENTTTWLGLAGGSSYGLGAYLSNKPRRLVYAAGVGAMACVKQAMIPYKVSAAEEDNLNHAITFLAESMPRIRGNNILSIYPLVEQGYDEILEAGLRLQSHLNQAGPLMIATVDRVAGQVNSALVSTMPDLSSVKEILDGLVIAHAKMQAPTETLTPTNPTIENAVKSIDSSSGVKSLTDSALCNTTPSCASTIQRLVKKFNAALPKDVLAACGVDKNIINSIVVVPDASLSVTNAADQTLTRWVEGGSGRYLARELVKTDMAPEITQPSTLGAELNIKVLKDTPPGEYQFVVFDTASDGKVFIKLVVSQKPGAADEKDIE